jgi:hypothetical protein
MNLSPGELDLQALLAEIAALRLALEFYADPTTWERPLSHPGNSGHHPLNGGSVLRLALIELDHGQVAKEALSK